MQELDVPAMMHASATCNPAFHTTGSHYLNVDATAFMQLLESRIFTDFPRLKIILTHGGGNVPFQEARYRALCIMNKWEAFEEFIRRLYFDTTVYGPGAMEMLVKVVGVDNIVFASEMLGGVTTVDPTPAASSMTTNRSSMPSGSSAKTDRRKIFEENVRKAYPRLGPILDRRQLASTR